MTAAPELSSLTREAAARESPSVIIYERRTARGCSQQGVRFDPDMPQTIRLEFAKSNTKVSKPKPAVATAAPAAHPALMHPLTGRKYRRTHTLPGAKARTPYTRAVIGYTNINSTNSVDVTLTLKRSYISHSVPDW